MLPRSDENDNLDFSNDTKTNDSTVKNNKAPIRRQKSEREIEEEKLKKSFDADDCESCMDTLADLHDPDVID